jgi:predicted RNA-binding protein with PIN domain
VTPEDRSTTADVPVDVGASIVRGLAAYIAAVPKQELPRELRRFKGYRPQALMRQRDRLLRALDDEELRGRVLEWLGDPATRLPEAHAGALRVASERAEGWEQRLLALSREEASPLGQPSPATNVNHALEAQRAKARRAREEARAAREEGRRELHAERARGAALGRQLHAAEAEAQALRASLDNARSRAQEDAAEVQRRMRRAEREIEKLRAERQALRAGLRSERKRSSALEERLEDLSRRRDAGAVASDAGSHGRSATARRARNRRPLPAPRGRFEDSSETLEDWLDEYDVHMLVDGYNVTRAPGGFGHLELSVQRERLIEEVERLARRKQATATIVFDGSEMPPGTARRRRGQVEVQYSKPPANGDDHLVALLQELPPEPVIVVTDDRELQERSRELGATVAGAGQLLSLIR